MSKTSKIITGILAFLPLLLFIGYFVLFFSFMFQMFSNIDPSAYSVQNGNPEFLVESFVGIFATMGLMILLTFGMLIYFIVHIANNPKLDSNERIVWILVIVFVGMFGFPIYWYLKIWKEDSPQAPEVL